MLVYIYAQTKVKAQTRNVYYVGDVQDDGYIYFNDSMMYRMPTPQNMTEGTEVTVTEAQVWYTIRNCWIRANYFTNLKVYPFDIKNMNDRIKDLEDRMDDAEDRLTDLENEQTVIINSVNSLGRAALGNSQGLSGNGKALLDVYNAVLQIIADVQTSATLPQTSIYTNWNDIT